MIAKVMWDISIVNLVRFSFMKHNGPVYEPWAVLNSFHFPPNQSLNKIQKPTKPRNKPDGLYTMLEPVVSPSNEFFHSLENAKLFHGTEKIRQAKSPFDFSILRSLKNASLSS